MPELKRPRACPDHAVLVGRFDLLGEPVGAETQRARVTPRTHARTHAHTDRDSGPRGRGWREREREREALCVRACVRVCVADLATPIISASRRIMPGPVDVPRAADATRPLPIDVYSAIGYRSVSSKLARWPFRTRNLAPTGYSAHPNSGAHFY